MVSGSTQGGAGDAMDHLEVIEVVLATPLRRVAKAFDREARQVVSVTSELIGERDPDLMLTALAPLRRLPRTRSVAPLLDAFVDGDRIVLVSSWVEGVDLLALLVASGTPGLPVTAVLAWLDQVGEAVRHLQANGVVHGDIRPANLVLSAEQRVVVVGLGAGVLDDEPGDAVESDVRGVAATAVALLTGSSPSVGAISGTAAVSGAALQRALLPALDDKAGGHVSLDHLLASLRHELNAALPTGVVTFLLTDIVGSTARWEADATAMAVQLAHHDFLMAEAVEAAGGRLLKARGEGDATFSVFTRASEAVAAALDAQQRLRAETELVVRMAIHTGEAELREADYFGRTVNRAARLRSVAPEGGVLLSSATADLVIDNLPTGVSLVSLGETQLKDLDRAERTYRLAGDALDPVVAVAAPVEGAPLAQLPRAVDLTAPASRTAGGRRRRHRQAAPLPAEVVVPPPRPQAPEPTPPAAAVPPRAPRGGRRGLVVAAGLLAAAAIIAVVLTAGGDDAEDPEAGRGDPTRTTETTPTVTEPPPLPLKERLLGLEDLPASFTRIEPVFLGDEAASCGQDVDDAVPPLEAAGVLAQTADGISSITEQTRRYRDAEQAAEGLAVTRASLSCSEARATTESGEETAGIVGTVEDLIILGAENGFLTDVTFGEFVVTVGVVKVDDLVVMLQSGGFPAPGVDLAEDLRLLLTEAVARLRG